MHAVVLAGGKGSRLRPFTFSGAKQLMPIANKPVLFYALEQLAEAGVTDVSIVVGETASQVEEACGSGDRWGLAINYVPQDEPRGIAHAIGICRENVGLEPFIVMLGDNFVREGIAESIARFREARVSAGLLLAHVPNPSAFGVPEFSDGKIARVVEKPADPPSPFAVTGIYYFAPEVFAVIDGLKPSARGELEVTDAIQGLIDRDLHVAHEIIEGAWIDTGKMEDILEANTLVLGRLEPLIEGEVDAGSTLTGPVRIDPGATVVNSTITGPAIIGPGARVTNSTIGPGTAIGANCRVEHVDLASSMVLDNATVTNVRTPIRGSLIGRNATVTGPGAEQPLRLVLGDYSEVETS